MSALNITKENFENEVIKSEVPVLIDFWAPWCGPCRMVGPLIEEISKEMKGKAKICKINVDEQIELASAFRVASIPTIVAVSGGKVVNSVVGARPKAELMKMIAI